jgi:nucleoid DNA-binding protein
VLHEVLREGGSVDVPGLGRFVRSHEPARLVRRGSDAKTMLVPPRDVVSLVAERDDDRL